MTWTPPWRRPRRAVTSTTARGDAAYFLGWFWRNRFALIESFLPALDHAPTDDERALLRKRFDAATDHAERVLGVRLVVTILLVLAGGSTIVSSALRYLDWLPGAADAVTRVAAVASTVTVLLLVARLALDRHLQRVEIFVTYVAMQIAGARGSSDR